MVASTLVHLRNHMMSAFSQFLRRLMQPWRFVCFASAVVGLVCFGLSSSFSHIFGKWNLLKVFLYSVLSLIICLAILFASTQQSPTNLRVKTHLVFLVLIITTVYSFFSDKVKGKPDAYSLISCAAFAIMSFILSTQTHYGFEVDLLYFFCGFLTLHLMEIKLFLVIVGAGFSYFLINLRPYLTATTESGHPYFGATTESGHDQEYVAIQVHSGSEETNTGGASAVQLGSPQNNTATMVTQVDSHSQQVNSDSDRIWFDRYIEMLAKMNRELNHVIWKNVKKYQEAFANSEKPNEPWMRTYEILVKEELINNLHETVKHMVAAGFEIECCNAYNVFRSKFVNKYLCKFGLKEVNLRNVEKGKGNIDSLVAACNVALKILLPTERRLWHRVFSEFSPQYEVFSTSDWRRMEIELWTKFLALETPNCYDIAQVAVLGSRLHPITLEVMNYIFDVSRKRDTAYFRIPALIRLLESNLDAISKNYRIPALGYLFRANNGRYIQLIAMTGSLSKLLGEDWDRIQTSKILQNIKHCLTSSWNEVLDLLKLESNESAAPDVTAKSMKDKLHLFNLHFEQICSDQSTWFVYDEDLGRAMRRSLEKRLLLVYENFLGRFRDVVGRHADQCIKYRTSDIQDRLSRLFLRSKRAYQWLNLKERTETQLIV